MVPEKESVIVGIVAYVAVVTLITLFNNDFALLEFCGSVQDFGGDIGHTGCISFAEYWGRAAVHLPYVAISGVVALGTAVGYQVNVLRIAREKLE